MITDNFCRSRLQTLEISFTSRLEVFVANRHSGLSFRFSLTVKLH